LVLLLGVLALALLLSLGISLFPGALPGVSQVLAARPGTSGFVPGGRDGDQGPAGMPTMMPTRMPTMMPGQCGGQFTVSKVSNATMTVTRSGGSPVTIHAHARTHYTEAGHPVSASAVRVGSTIDVVGTCTDHGRMITATSIEIIR
jgi:hypothetical protein